MYPPCSRSQSRNSLKWESTPIYTLEDPPKDNSDTFRDISTVLTQDCHCVCAFVYREKHLSEHIYLCANMSSWSSEKFDCQWWMVIVSLVFARYLFCHFGRAPHHIDVHRMCLCYEWIDRLSVAMLKTNKMACRLWTHFTHIPWQTLTLQHYFIFFAAHKLLTHRPVISHCLLLCIKQINHRHRRRGYHTVSFNK